MWSFHTIAPYCALFSHCQYHNRDSCSSAACRHWCPYHSPYHSPCLAASPGCTYHSVAQPAHCKVCTMGHGVYHPSFAFVPKPCEICMSKAFPPLLQLLEQQPQSGLWKSSCVPSASYIIFLIKVLKWDPAAILLLTHVTKHPSSPCHWLGRGSRNKNQKPLEWLWGTWIKHVGQWCQWLVPRIWQKSFIEMQFLELSMGYRILSLENVQCLTFKTFSHI